MDSDNAGDPVWVTTTEERTLAGRYTLGGVLGTGSSAVVHRGLDLRTGEAVAVKVFHPGAEPAQRRRQRRELALAAGMRHPGLVALYDGGVADGCVFVVTELVDGPTLAQRLREGPLPIAQARGLGAQLAEALAYVHAVDVVHRDVKPANVLLGDGTRVRLTDFGIARAVDGTVATATGSVVGTAAYLAPEQARGAAVGPPADVYALGLVLLEAVKGGREYPGGAVESATARLHRPPRIPATLPDGMGALLRVMTADDPAERPSAAVVAAVLRQLGAHGGSRHRRRAFGWLTALTARR